MTQRWGVWMGEQCEICGAATDAHDYEHEAQVCYPALMRVQQAEIERLRAALGRLRTIMGMSSFRPPCFDQMKAEIAGALNEQAAPREDK